MRPSPSLRPLHRAVLALALVMPAAAHATATPGLDALVPVPEAAELPPPGPADIGLGPAVDSLVPVPEPAPVVPPSRADVAPDAADPAFGAVLRAVVAERGGLSAEDRKLREALAAAYEARGFAPLWVEGGKLSARAAAVQAVLAGAAADGLDPADYPLPKAESRDANSLALAELRLSTSAVLYARHAMAGRIEPGRVHPLVTPRRVIPKPEEVIEALATATDPAAVLGGYHPPHAGYRALKAALAEARARTTEAPTGPRIPAGDLIRVGAKDARVPLLRSRLGVAGDAADTTYSGALVDAVKAFQVKAGIEATGLVGPQTLAALNQGPGARVNDLIANMELWRWLPRDLGPTHIFVNIPEFTVRVVHGGKLIHRTRVITGRPETPTPVFSDDMEYVVVNPVWNVPPSIVRNEMMPLLATDPSGITRQGLEVLVNGRPVDPYEARYADPNKVSFRQPPGERNALGKIKFMFPNQHHVYLHDTPNRTLFMNERRAYSHGCIRVHEPLRFGEVVFALGLPGEDWSQAKITAQFGGQERYIRFRERFPVHVAYFTLHADEAGTLQVREDIYRHIAQVKALLGLEGQVRVIANPNAAKPPPIARPIEPPSFLEQLFGIRPARGG